LIKKFLKIFYKTFRYLILGLGIISLVMIILSFTSLPWRIFHQLGTYHDIIEEHPDYIVVMGAGGMPGHESLMRCHFAALAAKEYPETAVIIAMPTPAEAFDESDAKEMAREIQQKGIDENRFLFETKGTNTYTQAKEIYKMLGDKMHKNLLIVTSPEHMYRCIQTFEKAGFRNVYGLPAFEGYLDENTLLTDKEKNERLISPDRSVNLRYNMWAYLKYEITLMREGIAIAWYKIRGYM